MILGPSGVDDSHPVALVQEQARRILSDYVKERHPNQPER